LSHRGKYPFVAVNCAAIPDNLFESEFFGHEKGAFTGAVSRKKGKFELANRGTIFLDEVGEIPLYLQGKLLRVLQEHVIERVGGEQSIKIDARIIAATNRDIKTMVKKGEFREDLFYRLNVISLHLPPLRERKKDIPIFINYFLKKFSGGKIGISNSAKDILIKYHYPGNIRELENIIQRAVALCSDNLIKPEDLPDEIKLDNLKEYDSGIDLSLNKEIERLEKNLILEALKKFEWNKSKAAKSLGINERVIRYKIEKYSLKKH
jgi:transcriptional regulator with PAS, ATPase and Fis domain